jgi:hypothetical protein
MEDREIDKIYPDFREWCKKKGYLTVDYIHLIKLWYEYLGMINEKKA